MRIIISLVYFDYLLRTPRDHQDGPGMTDGSIRMRVRAAVAGYMLLRWSVDCSPDHRLTEEQYRLWLSDPLALYGVENAKLAPGYRPPVGASKK